jgi:hypothetical protein
MMTALALVAHSPSELYAFSFDRLTKAVGALLDRAVAAGEIRADLSPEDVLRALIGMSYMHDQPGWQDSVMRLIDVFVDGLRVKNMVKRPTSAPRGKDTRAKSKAARPPRPGNSRKTKG